MASWMTSLTANDVVTHHPRVAGSDSRAGVGAGQAGYDQEAYWDGFFRRLTKMGSDLDWGGRWTDPFIPLLRASGARDVLELGCGTGHDAARLAAEGLRVVAVDLSAETIERARHTFGDSVGPPSGGHGRGTVVARWQLRRGDGEDDAAHVL